MGGQETADRDGGEFKGRGGMVAKRGGTGGCVGGQTGGTPRSALGGGTGAQVGSGGFVYQSDGVYLVRISPSRDGARVRWCVDAYYAGHRKSTRTCAIFREQDDALKCAAALWGDYASGVHVAPEAAPTTLGGLIERFCERTKGKRGRELSPKTAASYRSQLRSLLMTAGADCPLGHLTHKHIEAAIRVPQSQRSRFQYFTACRALVRWAVSKSWLAVDVTSGVEVDPGPSQMRTYLQPEEVEPFLAGCSPAFRIRAGLIVETGLRAGEAVNLRWSWIQYPGSRPYIRIPAHDAETGFKAKGRRVRSIPLSIRAQQLLEEAAKRWGKTGFVLHNEAKPILSSNWCKDTHEACAKAGVTDLDAHGLRRTAGVLWFAQGFDIFTISRLLGHQSVTTTEKAYVGIADSKLSATFDALDARRSVVATIAATTVATSGGKLPGCNV